jgi:Chaperone of endosialidase
LGKSAGSNLTTGAANIDIGNVGVAGESGTIRIGEPGVQIATFIVGVSTSTVSGVPVLVDENGRLGVATSSVRFKEGIQDIGDASHGLMKLRPVTFRYKPEVDPNGLLQYGLIAEEVAKVYPNLVVGGQDGQAETIRYQLLTPMLLNEIQRQQRTIEQQRDEIDDLESRLVRLERLVLAKVANPPL